VFPEKVPSATAAGSNEIFDALHWYERIVHISLGLYLIGVGGAMIWRALTGPDAVQVGQLLKGLLFAALLGPGAIYVFVFWSRPTAQALPMGLVKRIVGSLAALAVTVFGLAVMWMAFAHPQVREGVPPGVDWDMVLGPSAILVLGCYGLYAFVVKGVDVV
jgi:hypothetical protein